MTAWWLAGFVTGVGCGLWLAAVILAPHKTWRRGYQARPGSKQPPVPQEYRVHALKPGLVNKGGHNDLSHVDTRDRPPPPGSMKPKGPLTYTVEKGADALPPWVDRTKR